MLGDGAVGKTSLIRRFAQDDFGGEYKQTIGLDFSHKRVELPGGVTVSLQLWDIGGQSITSKMLTKYVTGAHGVVLCYDITSTDSFENLDDWAAVVRRAGEERAAKTGTAPPPPKFFVVGNKTDISHLRSVKMARHTGLASSLGGTGYLCSAKTGDQVAQAFFRIAADVAGVAVSRPDVQVRAKAITAHVISHKAGDGGEAPSATEQAAEREADGKGRRCAVM